METPIDFTNGTWTWIERWAQAQLSSARARNDSNTLTTEATAALRGEIAFAKKLIGLPQFHKDEEARDRADSASDY